MTTPSTSQNDERRLLRPLYQPPGSPFPHLIGAAIHLLLIAASLVAWRAGWYAFSVVLWIPIAWMDHAALSRLHEAAHRMLLRHRVGNELVGCAIGTLVLTPLSVYRYVHTQHHAHLGSEKDPEFWPYNLPRAPLWLRLTYVWLELLAGWIVTPLLYSMRTAFAWPSFNRRLRRRLLCEWTVLAAWWGGLLCFLATTGTWSWLVAGYLGHAWLAGSLQSLRKFTEHLGRHGNSILGMTRTVVYTNTLGRIASQSQLHVEQHATHHGWPGIPYYNLPEATKIVFFKDGRRADIYPSHWAALRDMLPHLRDPRLGPQWNSSDST